VALSGKTGPRFRHRRTGRAGSRRISVPSVPSW
jgi:hypothetical protein